MSFPEEFISKNEIQQSFNSDSGIEQSFISDIELCKKGKIEEIQEKKAGHIVSKFVESMKNYYFVKQTIEECCFEYYRQGKFSERLQLAIYFHENNLFTKRQSYIRTYFCHQGDSFVYLIGSSAEIFNCFAMKISEHIMDPESTKIALDYISKKGFSELFRFACMDIRFTNLFALECSRMETLDELKSLNLDMERLCGALENPQSDLFVYSGYESVRINGIYSSKDIKYTFDIHPESFKNEGKENPVNYYKDIDPYQFIAFFLNRDLKEKILKSAPIAEGFENGFPIPDEFIEIEYFANLRDFKEKFCEKFPQYSEELKDVPCIEYLNGCPVIYRKELEDDDYPDLELKSGSEELKFWNDYADEKNNEYGNDFFFMIDEETPKTIGNFEVLELINSGSAMYRTGLVDKIPVKLSKHSIVVYSTSVDGDSGGFCVCPDNVGIGINGENYVEGSDKEYPSDIVNKYIRFSFSEDADFTNLGIHIAPHNFNNHFKYNYYFEVDEEPISVCTNNFYNRVQWKQILDSVPKILEKVNGCVTFEYCSY